ncbi:MAG TPA: AraC family transcriptional regulator [Acidimicrobiia bacterium]|nr:AraC family transcriptional regulator [Acidimicrobiia bacterium]
MPETTLLQTTNQLAFGLSRCGAVSDGVEVEEVEDKFTLVFPLSGVFVIDLEGSKVVATAAKGILLSTGQSRRVQHPFGGHDASAFIAMSPAMADSFLSLSGRFRVLAGATSSAVDLGVRRLVTSAMDGEVGALELEEFTVNALSQLSEAYPERSASPNEAVRRVDEYLAVHFREDCGLAEVAHAVGYSSHHLSRSFRELTGETVSRRRMRLRLSNALSLILEGADDLATVAVESGFYDHSHMTNSFRRHYGDTPNGVRLSSKGGSAPKRRGKNSRASPL